MLEVSSNSCWVRTNSELFFNVFCFVNVFSLLQEGLHSGLIVLAVDELLAPVYLLPVPSVSPIFFLNLRGC